MSKQKYPTWPFWVLAGILLLPVCYLLSMGPLELIARKGLVPAWVTEDMWNAYIEPHNWLLGRGPGWYQAAVGFYLRLWM